ncbi:MULTISPECIES: MerR family transcriptional regulator [unclassified Rothia (in: high G+C Gram-positive bacteria)]|uniref:transcriptional regulator FtsR n=1 Tax=unclassified Rothia (in: high G+C Gram-positive bacteria) TaxID=2689056 RepID=UPI00195B2B07|nr:MULTISPECIES: MerR family transcriptional regulator [unclassified Rothia (in: high G+C Gram-positive bacteria)]MBM7050781.1 MerR family transcriptional regulator [Rothia sp. ZJ1223]QRZ60956.1 MerR family transcriptional regulator [Rothia sp. ZJ932]
MPHNFAESEEVEGSVRDRKNKTIGQVLSQLDADFPGISASKIRFLEDKGLVFPQRTNTGYRKYSQNDVERLRYILELQRDQYLPLKVIKDRLEAVDAGRLASPFAEVNLEAHSDEEPTGGAAAEPKEGAADPARTYSLRELAAKTGAELPLLRELLNHGLIRESETGYDEYDVVVVQVCLDLTRHGLQPRHLRSFRSAAEREVGLIETAVAPLALRKDASSRAQAAERAQDIAQLCLRLHMTLVAASMPTYE